MKLKTIIVDDEPVARKGIREFAQKVDYIEVVGEANDIDSLIVLLKDTDIDLLFMDIEMPGLSGIEFAKTYKDQLPLIIFITAYHQFAVESYDLHAVDYLLKPTSLERFSKAADKALAIAKSQANYRKEGEPFFVRHEGKYRRIEPLTIVYVSAMQNYVRIHTQDGESLIVRSTLRDFEDQLNSSWFLMVHKSYLVNTRFVDSVWSSHLQLGSAGQIPIGRAFKDATLKAILGKK